MTTTTAKTTAAKTTTATTTAPKTTTEPVPAPAVRIDLDDAVPAYLKAMTHLDHAATRELDRAGIDHRLRELVRVRASQLNGCAYCIDLHTRDARAAGETEQRLYALPAWRETAYFTARERAALQFTEQVTRLADTHVPDQAYADLVSAFSPAEAAALVCLVVTINAWNGLGVATRSWTPTPTPDLSSDSTSTSDSTSDLNPTREQR